MHNIGWTLVFVLQLTVLYPNGVLFQENIAVSNSPEFQHDSKVIKTSADAFRRDQLVPCSARNVPASDDGQRRHIDGIPDCHFENHKNNESVSCACVNITEIAMVIPADTKRLTIERSKTLELPDFAFSRLKKLEILNISASYVGSLLRYSLAGLIELKVLELTNNFLENVDENTFLETPNIERVNIQWNYILNFSNFSLALSKLSKLQSLDLSNNRLGKITSRTFAALRNATNVASLNLERCLISDVEKNSFLSVPNLRVLNVGHNPLCRQDLERIITSLKNTKIDDLNLNNMMALNGFPKTQIRQLEGTNITKLHMAYNDKFRNIPNNAFGKLKKLRFLDLRECRIEIIEDFAFHGLELLEELHLENNNLTTVSPAVTSLPNLRKLYLASTGQFGFGFTLQDNKFFNMTTLEVLDLSGLRISNTIDKKNFVGLKNLKTLLMNNCDVKAIEDFAFRDLVSLTFLSLSENLIGNIRNSTFYGLSSLEYLVASHNKLTFSSTERPFSHLRSIRLLDLTKNQINCLPENAFSELNDLMAVNLSSNLIKPWTYKVFPNSGNLRIVHVDANEISYVSSQMLDEFKTLNLQYLGIHNNQMDCSACGMADFQEWFLQKKFADNSTKYDELEQARYPCATPVELEGESFLNVTIPTENCQDKDSMMLLFLTISVSLFLGAAVGIYCIRWYIRYCCFLLRVKVRKYKDSVSDRKYQYDAFVSYCATERQWVLTELVPTLEGCNSNLKLCLHDRDFEVGRLITDNILESIESSRKTILVLTDAYVRSKWCMLEMNMAQHRLFDETRNALILVELNALNKTSLPKTLKYVMKTRTYIVWKENLIGQKLFWERLIDALKKPSQKRELPV